MKKRIVILTVLLALTAFQGLAVESALGDSGTFTTMWVIDLPRQTYFIGETVTFTVTAFASTDPSLLLPDQMAKITIRNASLIEVYSTWITTNSNGSAPIAWETGLNATAENYTIILDDLKTTKVTATFNLLFNEETYWQTRVDQLQKDLQTDRNYLNYLFAMQKYQQGRLNEIDRLVKIFGVLAFVTVMCAIYVGMHELAGSKRSSSGLMVYPSKAVELLFRTRPAVELDHEILEDVHTPREKRVPIYGHDQFCPICDPDKRHKLTENQLKDHLWAKHDRLHLKKESIRAKWRARRAERELAARKKDKEAPKLTLVSTEKAKEEWSEDIAKRQFEARLKDLKSAIKKGELTPEEKKAEIAQLKADLDKANGKMPEPQKTTSAKPELQRKVRGERQLSSPIFPTPSPSILKPIKMTQSKTKIDELYDQLSNKKEMN
jgi:hypothetical protein